ARTTANGGSLPAGDRYGHIWQRPPRPGDTKLIPAPRAAHILTPSRLTHRGRPGGVRIEGGLQVGYSRVTRVATLRGQPHPPGETPGARTAEMLRVGHKPCAGRQAPLFQT